MLLMLFSLVNYQNCWCAIKISPGFPSARENSLGNFKFFENDQKHLHSATFGESLHGDVFWKIIETYQMCLVTDKPSQPDQSMKSIIDNNRWQSMTIDNN